MLIKNIDMLCTKLEMKKGKEDKQYLLISVLDLSSGDLFDIVERENFELLGQLTPMQKYNLTLKLSSSKFGLNLSLESINKNQGSI